MLAIIVMIQVFHRLRKKEAEAKENQKDMSCRKEGR